MKNKIRKIIAQKTKKEFADNQNIISEHIIDSLDFIDIIEMVEEEFNIEIDFENIDPNDVLSVDGLTGLVKNELE